MISTLITLSVIAVIAGGIGYEIGYTKAIEKYLKQMDELEKRVKAKGKL